MSIIDELRVTSGRDESFMGITFGRVIDTNDPDQMGRLRIFCPALNDTEDKKLKNIPWATYVSPFAGMVERGSRGRSDDVTVGPVAYGMWNIPKVGTTVLVACIDGDTSVRVWLGCVHNQLLTHTMPHGRFSYRDELVKQSGFGWDDDQEGKPLGPFSSQEEPIEPAFTQLNLAFTATPEQDVVGSKEGEEKLPQDNFEYRTRGADHGVSGLSEAALNSDRSNTSFLRDDADIGDGNSDTFTESDGEQISTERVEQGYNESRLEPGLETNSTVKNYDSQVYSWTTPGFHAIAMDDSSNNCRVRFRTTHGHQIILDDTNERIYISTAGGKTWCEMDEKGNIDYYAERNISFHAEEDFNITAKNIRMKAAEGVHVISEGQIRLHSINDDIHVKSDKNVRIHSGEQMRLQSIGNLHIKTNDEAYFTSTNDMDILSENGVLQITAASNEVQILAVGDGKFTSNAVLHLKGDDTVNTEGVNTVNIKSASVNVEGSSVANIKSAVVNVDGSATANIKSAAVNIQASGIVAVVGGTINLNSGGAAGSAGSAGAAGSASAAVSAETTLHKNAFWTNRVPEHEPWPRVMTQEFGVTATDNDGPLPGSDPAHPNPDLNTHINAAEYLYDEVEVGRMERGVDLTRNDKWHR